MGVEIIIICIVAAAVVSAIIMLIVRSSLTSVYSEDTACNYVRGGSFKLTAQNDMFLRRNVVRTRRAKPKK